MIDKRLLHGVKLIAVGQPFDCLDFLSIGSDRKHQAPINSTSVKMNRTSAAFTAIATLLGAGEVEAFSQNIQQSRTGFNLNAMANTIDYQADGGTRNKWWVGRRLRSDSFGHSAQARNSNDGSALEQCPT
jgi:hypothetical protein